jgi:hypothetical protein
MAVTYGEAVRNSLCRTMVAPLDEADCRRTPCCGRPVAGEAEGGWLGDWYCALSLAPAVQPGAGGPADMGAAR